VMAATPARVIQMEISSVAPNESVKIVLFKKQDASIANQTLNGHHVLEILNVSLIVHHLIISVVKAKQQSVIQGDVNVHQQDQDGMEKNVSLNSNVMHTILVALYSHFVSHIVIHIQMAVLNVSVIMKDSLHKIVSKIQIEHKMEILQVVL